MLTANYLMNVAEPMVDLWAQVEDDIVADISRRLAKNAGTMTETAKWQALKAREMGILQTDIASTVSRITGQSQKETYGLIVQACQKALAYDDALYMKHGLSPIPLAQSAALQDVIMAGCRKTNGLMRNFTRTLADTASKAFENAMDRAWLQVNTGAFSYTEALNRAIRDLSAQGIQKIAYPSGHVDRMDVAARRALITGLNQTTAELQLARMDELQTDLIEVSSHAGARPTHAIWQGQVYQKTGRGKYENFYDETGYGTGDGLCGWNCYHSFFPYFEGMSHQAFERDPSARLGKSNDQMYEESQRQRALERRIRDSRRACAASSAARDAATDPQAKAALEAQFEKDAALLKEREQALDDFCAQTGRTKLVDRVYVPTYNRSVSSKTTWAARRANANKPASPGKAPAAKPPAPAPAPAASADGKTVFSKLSGTTQSHDSYRASLAGKFDSGTDTAKKVFQKYIPAGGNVVDSSFTGTAHLEHATGNVLMSYDKDAKNVMGAGTTFFHEHGHYVDFKSGWVSEKHPSFTKALKDDYEAALKATGKATRSAQQRALKNDLIYTRDTIHSVSDIMEGASNGVVKGNWGHGKNYWKNPTALPHEAFAHMFEASFSPEKTKHMQKYFPTAWKEFGNILEGIK